MLVAFSHLRWDSVWQRPQHLLTRFARETPVLVVEEPKFWGKRADVRLREEDGVTIATPLLSRRSPGHRWGFGAAVNAKIAALIDPLIPEGDDLTLWYYTPMALGAEPPSGRVALRVYDAMDDLASFESAPAEMRAQEARLLSAADLVFTGGPTLYRQRQPRHPAVFCFPSGVEPEHFGAARNGIARPAKLARRPRPILGYFGVIDERMDLDLLAGIADLRPEWTIVLVGPVAKIDKAEIPARENIVRVGQRPYAELPGFLASFDVALLPFARNAATRAISPTKTLEYLAGGRPVISTPIADVVDLYGDVVSIAATAGEVVAEAERLLRRSPAEEAGWLGQVDAMLDAHSWDRIAARMGQVMAERRGRIARSSLSRSAIDPMTSLLGSSA
ncbi:MAG: glycosyltransferase [Thermomicrobiales bacterium]|nr:glycosyltransferase [Thermomicrobiales bacterium]